MDSQITSPGADYGIADPPLFTIDTQDNSLLGSLGGALTVNKGATFKQLLIIGGVILLLYLAVKFLSR